MDPHKDFVKVDDAFRQLKESSDDEMPAGAWLRMKDILDASLPVGVAVTRFSWKKYLTPFLVTLLVSSSAILGYNYFKSDTPLEQDNIIAQKDIIGDNAIAAIPNKGDNNIAPPSVQNEHYASNVLPENVNHRSLKPSTANKVNNTISTNTAKAINENIAVNNNKQNNTQNTLNNINNTSNNNANAGAIDNKSIASQKTNNEANNTHGAIPLNNSITAQLPDANVLESNNNIANNITRVQDDHLSTVENNNQNGSNDAVVASTLSSANDALSDNKNAIVEKEITDDGTTIVKKGDGEWYKEINKEVKAVDINQKTIRDANNNLVRINDTVNVGYKEVTTYIPLTRIELTKLGKLPVQQEDNRMILASANRNITKKADKDITLLEDVKVSRKVYKDLSATNDMLYKFNNELNRLFNNNGRFYAAMYMGGNYTPLGSADGLGYQLGFATFMNMGERWALAAELRYVRKHFVNYVYSDKSKLYDVEKNGDIYYGTEEIRDNTYSFKGFSAIELPIYLGYEISNRLTMYGGINGMYLYPLKYQVDKSYSFNDTYISTVEPQSTYLNINDDIDFVPRFGLGYVAGIGFNASKKVGVDFRITQMMIDNSVVKSPLINRIAQAPSFQLSFTYFIGKKENIVYILER